MAYQKTGGLLTVQGLDTSKPAEYLKPENTPNVQNMRVYREVLRKREGQTVLGSNVQISTNTKLYLPFDGSDTSTTITDLSFTPHTVTANGDAQIDTAQSVFGGASCLFDGTGDFLSTPDSDDWSFGTGDFNVRMRVRFNSLTGQQYLINQYVDSNNFWGLCKLVTSHKLQFVAKIGGVAKASYVMTSNWSASTGTWYEIEIARVGTNFYIRIDGVAQTLTVTNAISTNDLGALAGSLYIGAQNSASYFNGWMDELILTKGDGIHSANYTINTAALTTEALNEYVMGGRYLLREGVGYHLRVGPTKIQKYNSTKLGWENIHGTLLTATNTDPVDFATPLLTGKRILAITNFIDNIRKYTGTGNTADLGGTPPKAKFMTEYKDYLLLAYISDGGSTYPTRTQWCDTANPEAWASGNAGNKDLNDDNEDITGCKLFGEYASVHKHSAIYLGYLVTTSSVFQFDRKATGSGTINHATIQTLPSGDQAFLALDGIRLFNGTTAPNIGGSVTDELRESMNFSYIKRAWSLIVPELDEYWCGVPLGSSQVGDTVYKYNFKTGVVHKDLRTGAISAWRYSNISSVTWDDVATSWDSYTPRWDETASGVDTLIPIIGDTDGLTTYRDINVANDNGVAIDAFFETKDFEADEKGRLARWLQMEFWAKGNTVTIEYSTDSGQTWNAASTITLGSDYPTDDSPDIYYFDAVSTKIRFRFRNLTLGSSFTLKQFVVGYKNREARK